MGDGEDGFHGYCLTGGVLLDVGSVVGEGRAAAEVEFAVCCCCGHVDIFEGGGGIGDGCGAC